VIMAWSLGREKRLGTPEGPSGLKSISEFD
jgi:hypothetical protein